MNKYSYSHTDPWIWERARHLDIPDIIALMRQNYEQEVDGIFTPNETIMSYNLSHAIIDTIYDARKDLISVARSGGKLVCWSWLGLGNYMRYSNEEIAGAEFIHVDLTLSPRQRLRLIAQTLEMWEQYCILNKIPVLSSSSIRNDHVAFMRLHEKMGFTVHGTTSYKRIIWSNNEPTSNIQ